MQARPSEWRSSRTRPAASARSSSVRSPRPRSEAGREPADRSLDRHPRRRRHAPRAEGVRGRAPARARLSPDRRRRAPRRAARLRGRRASGRGRGAPGALAMSGPRFTERAPEAARASPLTLAREVLRQPGAPLDARTRARFENRFGHDFGRVRVHTDARAAASAGALAADAWTLGTHIAFAPGRYAAGSAAGEQLLAHEFAHIVRPEPSGAPAALRVGGAEDPAELEARSLGERMLAPRVATGGRRAQLPPRPRTGVIRRQTVTQPPARQATVADAADFLEMMARFIQDARDYVATVLQTALRTQASTAARQRAHTALNQQKLRDLLANARRVFEVQAPALEAGSADGTRLRRALLAVIAKVRAVAPEALAISDAMPAPKPTAERELNAQLVVELIEADPFTSAGLVGTPAFGAAETAAGASHEAFIDAYLDDLIRALPGQSLAPAARDQILQRISAGLRRAFLTVGTGPAGTVDVRAISNPAIVSKYRRGTGAPCAAGSARPPPPRGATPRPPRR